MKQQKRKIYVYYSPTLDEIVTRHERGSTYYNELSYYISWSATWCEFCEKNFVLLEEL